MVGRMLSIVTKHARSARFVSVVLSYFIVCVVGSAAVAQNSWTVKLTEKELKLQHPTDGAWDQWFQSDIGFQRMVERNQPWLELTNSASSTDPITQFHITIGDERFNFANVSGSSPVQLAKSTPGIALAASTIDFGNELEVNIGGGGLAPGQTVRFKIKMGIDSSFQAAYKASFGDSLPDYRTILFDMNGNNVYDGTVKKSSEDNAHAFVIFDPGGQSSTTAFEDEDVAVSQFFNNNIRGGCCCTGDPVLIFQIDGSAPIPEPASITLVMFGVAAIVLQRRPRRRSAA